MAENIRKAAFAFGRLAQSDLATINDEADLIRFPSLSREIGQLDLQAEDDREDLGKDDEFAANVYPTNWDFRQSLEMQLTSESLAWALAFALGSSTDSSPATGAYRHTATPQSSGIELPSFTAAVKLPSDGSLLNFAAIGCVLDGFTVQLNSGPGRNNARLLADIVGSGKFAKPSGLTFPAVGTLHNLNAGSAAVTILGTNYVTSKQILSLEIGWRNNVRLDSGFFVGSGSQSGAAIRGRMEHGDREATLAFTVRRESSPDEQAVQIAGTEGTAVITLQGALITGSTYHDASFTFHRVRYRSVQDTDVDGIAARRIECSVMKHSSNGLLTAYATNEIDLFGTES